jgi:transposase InsO family protein
MITDDQIDLTYSAFSSSSSDYGIVDSGSSAIILQSRNANMVRDSSPSSWSVCTAEPGGSLSISGEGSCGKFDRVLVFDNIRENIISVFSLADQGINSLFTKDGVKFLISDTGMVVATGARVRGLYRIPLEDVFSQESVFNIGSTQPDVDPLILFHQRTGDTAPDILREAVRTQLVEGVSLPRSCFTKKGRTKFKCLCDICARAKIARISFPRVCDCWLTGVSVGDYVSADILVMLNIPSREGYRYALHTIDHASKTSWVYPLKTRETKELLSVIRRLVEEDFPKHSIVLRQFHSDGGSELIAKELLQLLHAKHVNTSHSPRDTPQMNSISERRTRTIKEKMLCLLLRASLPVAFWWWALQRAVFIIIRPPSTTAQGYKTPFECVTGRPPNLRWLHI